MKVNYFQLDINPSVLDELINGLGKIIDAYDSGSSNGRKAGFELVNAGSSPAPETTSKANFATIGGSYVSR